MKHAVYFYPYNEKRQYVPVLIDEDAGSDRKDLVLTAREVTFSSPNGPNGQERRYVATMRVRKGETSVLPDEDIEKLVETAYKSTGQGGTLSLSSKSTAGSETEPDDASSTAPTSDASSALVKK